jgi:hypothetical protein
LLRICHELSEEVASELAREHLKASKVNLKIKTSNFETFTRTKSLSSYTNESSVIGEAAEGLLLNEWTASQGRLSLRLIGVRVSDLKEDDEVSALESKKSNSIKKYFEKIEASTYFNYGLKQDPSTESSSSSASTIDLKFLINFVCPHCGNYMQGNEDFFEHHLDLCLLGEF